MGWRSRSVSGLLSRSEIDQILAPRSVETAQTFTTTLSETMIGRAVSTFSGHLRLDFPGNESATFLRCAK